jgi:hypothetical protein
MIQKNILNLRPTGYPRTFPRLIDVRDISAIAETR